MKMKKMICTYATVYLCTIVYTRIKNTYNCKLSNRLEAHVLHESHTHINLTFNNKFLYTFLSVNKFKLIVHLPLTHRS